MSSENVETVRRGYEAYARAGVEAFLPLLDPEFELTTTPDLAAEPDTYRGEDGIRRYFDSFEEAMEEIRFEPLEFIDAGEHVIVPQRQRMRGRASGVEVDVRSTQVWTVRGGKLVRMEFFPTRAEALEAVGPRESNSLAGE